MTDPQKPRTGDLPDNVPLPGEHLLDHEYDGIREADNPLPRWWVMLFVVSIIFAVVYFPVVHIFNFLPRHELQQSIALASRVQEQRELELEASGALDKDPVAAGQKYFKTFCTTCHGTYAEGGLCPNLTDNYWIHGPTRADIERTITQGVAAKGMPSWGPVLGERKIRSLAAYVTTLWQTPPPVTGKKPEGQEYDMAAIRNAETPVPDTTQQASAAADSIK
jgi:cytochrome c oxidase cbb3-type subunit 3